MNLLKPLCRPLLTLLLVVTLGGCNAKLLSWQEEVQLGEEAAPQFISQSGGELPDTQVVNRVRALGTELVAAALVETPDKSRPDLPWEFHVLDSEVINAFALPGGKVFISRGLMEKLDNEAQLAGVLGHEIGHVTARHGNQRMTQAFGIQVLATVILAGAEIADSDIGRYLGLGATAGGQLFLLKYSRANELEADALGVKYMARVGYNPVGQIQVMEVLRAAGGGSGGPEWLSTHPAPDTRISDLKKLIKQSYPDYDADPPVYRMRAAEYKLNFLIPLSKLPPARHGTSALIGPDQIEAVAGITWEQAIHRHCDCHKPAPVK